MMTEVTLDEIAVAGTSDDTRLVLRTTIRFDDGDRPRRRRRPSVDTTVRAAIPGIVGELFGEERSRNGTGDA